jgi:hypothetical protein
MVFGARSDVGYSELNVPVATGIYFHCRSYTRFRFRLLNMSSQVPPPLPQGAGYGVVVGLGVAFAIGTLHNKNLKKGNTH